ncbi:hypothetical protein MIMGU_mgv11b017921mg [Erythranthe guttata]|uniref:Uncharacterized protein n=1 Tax=Erythranthe guttata TaxID=4155 RepID=A0A022PQ60_ERYGU|nr:hypothetical protein MIMGU_mgv11b017921mg [Erythranthe guttata]
MGRSSEEETHAHNASKKVDKMGRSYLLNYMSAVLQTQNELFATSNYIMEKIKEMFGDQNSAARHVAMKALMNMHMA